MMERPNYCVRLETIEEDRHYPKLRALTHSYSQSSRTYDAGASYDVTSIAVYYTHEGPSDDRQGPQRVYSV